MCTYTGSHFGARYEDACCIDGYLWDTDSGDEDDMLTSGGDVACPMCNLENVLLHFDEDALNHALNNEDHPSFVLSRWLLTGRLRELHGLNAFRKAAQLNILYPFAFSDGWTKEDDPQPLGRLAWPWPLPDAIADTLTAHERVVLAAIAGPPPDGFALTQDGLFIRPVQPGEWM